jgi:hypothetical protein
VPQAPPLFLARTRQLPPRLVINVNQGSDTVLIGRGFRRRVPKAGMCEVAKRRGAVLLAANADQPVDLEHTLVIRGYRHPMHG